MLKHLTFTILVLIHIMIWLYVIFAFLNEKTAYYNLYYVIPIIFIIHIFPIHFINRTKKSLYPSDWEEKAKDIEKNLLIGYVHEMIRNIFSDSFASPISPQGMLILGAILSSYSLKSNLKIL